MIALNPTLLWAPPPRRPRSPWPLTLLILVGLLCWCVGERASRGEPGPNTGAASDSASSHGGARPTPRSEAIDEPRVHRSPQPPLGQDPARTLPGSLRALATWMGAVSLLALCGLIWLLYSSAGGE